MNNIILIRTSFRAIKNHKLRSFLTILGIMIGIASIIVTFSVGRGAQESVRNQILAMGENATYFIPGNITSRGAVASAIIDPPRLKYKDVEALLKQVPEIQDISRSHVTIEPVTYGASGVTTQAWGQDASILKINKHTLKSGIFFNDAHSQHRTNVVVLGDEVASQLFQTEDPIGKVIKIRNIPFTVIGVINKIGVFWGLVDPNMRVYLPFTVAKKYFKLPTEADDDVTGIAISTKKLISPGLALRKMKYILRLQHELKDTDPDDFTVFDEQTIAQSATAASNTIKLFGLLAASISLIVGGIGVMNIMLVSVQERTREIGIRLALGATQLNIQMQFLMEAITLCSIGGVIGIFLGLFTMYAVDQFGYMKPVIELLPLIISFIVTILVGIFFGFYPARKASLLNPVDALRAK